MHPQIKKLVREALEAYNFSTKIEKEYMRQQAQRAAIGAHSETRRRVAQIVLRILK